MQESKKKLVFGSYLLISCCLKRVTRRNLGLKWKGTTNYKAEGMPTGKPLIGVMNAASLSPPLFLYLNTLHLFSIGFSFYVPTW